MRLSEVPLAFGCFFFLLLLLLTLGLFFHQCEVPGEIYFRLDDSLRFCLHFSYLANIPPPLGFEIVCWDGFEIRDGSGY